MKKLRILISGATSGIGKETAKYLAQQGVRLILACRNREKTASVIEELKNISGNGNIESVIVDFSVLASVRECAEEITRRTDKLDMLINNAGAFFLKRAETTDGYERTFQVNYLGHFLFTHLLLPLLTNGAGPRIINVGSDSHYYGRLKWDDLHYTRRKYSGFKAYAASRLATMMWTAELSERVTAREETETTLSGITVNCGHPGHVDTNIWQFDDDASFVQKLAAKIQKRTAITPEEGAKTIMGHKHGLDRA